MLSGLGTAREQWAEAGVEVFLGRLTIDELHALGAELLKVRRAEVIERRRTIDRLERDLEHAREGRGVAEEEARDAELKAAKLRTENDALRKRIAQLEGPKS